MKKYLAIVSMVVLTGCGDGVSSTITNPTSNPCVITINGQGNVTGCGNVTVAVTAPSPTPGSTPTPVSKCLKTFGTMEETLVGIQATVGRTADDNERNYTLRMIAAVQSKGYPVIRGYGDDEIRVKRTVDALFSETYDVWNQRAFPQVLYLETCTPAEF